MSPVSSPEHLPQRPSREHDKHAGLVQLTQHYRDSVHSRGTSSGSLGTEAASPRRRRLSIEWKEQPTRVLVALPPSNARAVRALAILCEHLVSTYDMEVLVEESLLIHTGGRGVAVLKERCGAVVDDVHIVICLGGDGTMLHVVNHLFPRGVPPILPFNLGSLGFNTPFDFKHHPLHIRNLLAGGTNVLLRMRLKCQIVRKQNKPMTPYHSFDRNMLIECPYDAEDAEYHVLNEIVIDRGAAPYLSNLEVECDNAPFTRVQADGLIIATPTGSTAYSLSAGGSMVHPDVPAILFTPICPHTLSFRPVQLPDYVVLTIKVPEDARSSCWVSFDGRHRMELDRGDKVIVSVSKWNVPTFCLKDASRDWFKSITSALHWNVRIAQGSNEAGDDDDIDSIGPLPPPLNGTTRVNTNNANPYSWHSSSIGY